MLEILETLDPSAVAQEHYTLFQKLKLQQQVDAGESRLAAYKARAANAKSKKQNTTPDSLKVLPPPVSGSSICLDKKSTKLK